MDTTVPVEWIASKIYLIRGQKVMIDRDLAELYGVETGALNRAVKRNADRFPEDFMFQITEEETEFLRCQFGISNFETIRQLVTAPEKSVKKKRLYG